MAEKEDDQSIVGSNEESPKTLMSEIQKLRSEMLEKLDKLTAHSEKNKKASKTHAQQHAEILEKLRSIADLVSTVQPGAVVETNDTVLSPIVSSSLTRNNSTMSNPEIAKSFVLKHVFKNAEKFEIDKRNLSELEEHFGINWCINLVRKDNFLQFYLRVHYPGENCEIETTNDLKIFGPNRTEFKRPLKYCFNETGGWGLGEYLKWEEVMKNYLEDGNLTAEIHVKILETKGLRKEKFRSFDESVKDVSDIVLVVKDRKFHVLKKFLAAQSSFFKALLLGNFAESKKSEVTLTGIDPEDFHFFLEVLYGEPAVDETNVEGISLLADMYDAPTVIRRCEEFMLEKSKKQLKRKLHMADQYHLDGLKKRCLREIKSFSDLKSAMPSNFQHLEHSTVVALLEKSISFGES